MKSIICMTRTIKLCLKVSCSICNIDCIVTMNHDIVAEVTEVLLLLLLDNLHVIYRFSVTWIVNWVLVVIFAEWNVVCCCRYLISLAPVSLDGFQDHPWITKNGQLPMLSEEDNCHLVTVTGEEVHNSVKIIPCIAALVSNFNAFIHSFCVILLTWPNLIWPHLADQTLRCHVLTLCL